LRAGNSRGACNFDACDQVKPCVVNNANVCGNSGALQSIWLAPLDRISVRAALHSRAQQQYERANHSRFPFTNDIWRVRGRLTESAAVVAVVQKPRIITPRFGKPVTIQPAPKLERISATSALPILNR